MKQKLRHRNLSFAILMLLVIVFGVLSVFAYLADKQVLGSVLILLAMLMCFIGGYQASYIDKEVDIHGELRHELKSQISIAITHKFNDLSLDHDDMNIVRKLTSKKINEVLDEYLDIN
jgi:hypothetical protein